MPTIVFASPKGGVGKSTAAVLLATHDPQAAAVADRVCGLRDGKLLEGDAATELYASSPQPVRLTRGLD